MNSSFYRKVLKNNALTSDHVLKLKNNQLMEQDNNSRYTNKSTFESFKKKNQKLNKGFGVAKSKSGLKFD